MLLALEVVRHIPVVGARLAGHVLAALDVLELRLLSCAVAPDIRADHATGDSAAGRGEIDIAFLGPTSYVKLREVYGERPLLARQQIGASPVFHGKIFVRADSPVRSTACRLRRRPSRMMPRRKMR